MKNIFFLLFISLLVSSCWISKKETADTIYTNGRIYTVNEGNPWAEAFAIKDGKFLQVGTNEEIESYLGEETVKVNLDGKLVLPGLIDAHNHALAGADDQANLHIKNPNDREAILREIKEYVEANPEIEVIRGGSWNLGVFPDDNPSKELLDEIVPDKPVYLMSQSGHSAWLNSKALELAGINKNTPITKKIIYSKDPQTGEPSGRVDEYAMSLIEKALPPTSPQRMIPGLKKIQKMFNSYGITSIKLAEGRINWVETALQLNKKGELTTRIINSWDWGSHSSPHSAEEAERYALDWQKYSSEMVDSRSVKVFYDGAFDSYSALLLEDYEGRPGFKGSSHHSKEVFQEGIERMNKNGTGVIIHVMGDGAARELVDIFEAVRKKNGENGAILQLSHAVQATPEDLERLAKIPGTCVDFSPALGVVVPELAGLFADPIGEERYQKQLNVKSCIEAGVPTGFGSDWPSSIIPEPNTFWYLETWVNRRLPGTPDAAPHNPEQAVSIEQAIKAYTLGSAQCMGYDWSDKVGSIEEGKLADFIVVDRDLFNIPVNDIHNTLVDLTVVGGRVVFDREEEEKGLDIVEFEITNEDLNNAIDAAELNLFVQDELWGGGCACFVSDHTIEPGATNAPAIVNEAFANLASEGHIYARPARTIFWKANKSTYWIQWTVKNETNVLWAYDPELMELVEILHVKDNDHTGHNH